MTLFFFWSCVCTLCCTFFEIPDWTDCFLASCHHWHASSRPLKIAAPPVRATSAGRRLTSTRSTRRSTKRNPSRTRAAAGTSLHRASPATCSSAFNFRADAFLLHCTDDAIAFLTPGITPRALIRTRTRTTIQMMTMAASHGRKRRSTSRTRRSTKSTSTRAKERRRRASITRRLKRRMKNSTALSLAKL